MTDETLIARVVSSIEKIDLTPLAQFEAWKDDLSSVDLLSGGLYMRRYLQAYDWCNKTALKCHERLEKAIIEVKHQEAKAKLERFHVWYEANKGNLGKVKDSSSLREAYVPLDEEYRLASEKVVALRSIAKLLDLKAESFRMAHDDAKKLYSGAVDGSKMSGGGVGLPSGGRSGDFE